MNFSGILTQRPGLRTVYHRDGDVFHVETIQDDVEPILDRNKAMARETGKDTGRRFFVHVASIPIAVQYQWIKEHGVDPLQEGQEDLLRRLLNDPDYRYLRTSELVL